VDALALIRSLRATSIQDRLESIKVRMRELEVMCSELVGLLASWKECGGVKQA
jgi:hypothetical protein